MTMNATQIRQTFLDFFKSKGHEIVPSAPLVIKNDPTLLFTNAGMNQFKDLFLGNAPVKYPRIADTQKCLRVSGKHNDLEEVGVDTYHHTLFEMLGNWSFGDYFKKEAIEWSWELLTKVYKIDPTQLYVTVFEGSTDDGLAFDQEAYDYWKKLIPEDRIIKGNKKDNFWEMGDTGPCGPCSEIHVDIRPDRNQPGVPTGKSLVNASHPQVIEIWNNVFMEFNRKADGSLEKLPAQHVDTGMGFERLCVVLQGKTSNYDTDVFQPLIQHVCQSTGKKYGENPKHDIALRVIADHIRAIVFSIADGQLPSNNGAGYVIRRILRRALRYGYQTLEIKDPFLCQLAPVLIAQMGATFPEIQQQQALITKVILEEETAFFKTLGKGLVKLEKLMADAQASKGPAQIPGKEAFELYDTFGFPIDLTQLVARENQFEVDMVGFVKAMDEQKSRSRAATATETGDWVELNPSTENQSADAFVGYTTTELNGAAIVRYRQVKLKNKEQFQVVLNSTPFYAESGGQVGDTGLLKIGEEQLQVLDTKRENGLILHVVNKLPQQPQSPVNAIVEANTRANTQRNHSATHLLHAALRKILGTHVEQKGSLVNANNLRFDFSHFEKISDADLLKIEQLVNQQIRANHAVITEELGIEQAKAKGAMALFGEKYGEKVRVVTMNEHYSIELCGGTHVKATGEIGYFKITSESAVAAGIRRIEAITGDAFESYFNQQVHTLQQVGQLLKNPKDPIKAIESLLADHQALLKTIEQQRKEKVLQVKTDLLNRVVGHNGNHYIIEKIGTEVATGLKDLLFELRNEVPRLVCCLAYGHQDKAGVGVIMADDLVKEQQLNANNLVRELSPLIQGKGGGQPFFATAGGTDPKGVDSLLELVKQRFLS